MSQLLAAGISHRTAPLQLRERLAFTSKQAARFCETLVASEGIEEAVVLSTCNRTELYIATQDGSAHARLARLLGLLARECEVDDQTVAESAFALHGEEVEQHLYRVTGGLDSMVIGESEIQGQVKRALEQALAIGTTGPYTSRLFSTALRTGKRIRTETRVGAARTSVASIAVELAAKAAGPLSERAVTMIGTGQAGESAAKVLAGFGARTTFVANRKAERARELAERFGGDFVPLAQLEARLWHTEVLICATASPHCVIEAGPLAQALGHGRREMVLVDLAVPRDIDPACRELPGVTMYDLDDLQLVADETLVAREAERAAAELIVDQEAERFGDWIAKRRTPGRRGRVIELFGAGSERRESSSA